jgi:hypothetical protein
MDFCRNNQGRSGAEGEGQMRLSLIWGMAERKIFPTYQALGIDKVVKWKWILMVSNMFFHTRDKLKEACWPSLLKIE